MRLTFSYQVSSLTDSPAEFPAPRLLNKAANAVKTAIRISIIESFDFSLTIINIRKQAFKTLITKKTQTNLLHPPHKDAAGPHQYDLNIGHGNAQCL